MLQNVLKCTVIAAAIAGAFAAGGVQAQSYVTAGGQPVRSSDGACWRTAHWTPDAASEECDPQLVAKAPAPMDEPTAAAGASLVKPAAVKTVPVSYTFDVLFGFNDDRLGGDARKRLDELSQKLVAMEVVKITAVGHADVIGSSHYNQLLSARRVWAVRDYLAGKGITLELVHLEARGDSEATASTACEFEGTEEGTKAKLIACLQPDRRVKIEVIGQIKAFD